MERWMRPMLANPGTEDMRFDDSWAAEGKLDGWRLTVYRDQFGKVHMFGGRNAADYTGHLPLLDCVFGELLNLDTCIDGELLAPPPLGREYVQSVMFTQQPSLEMTAPLYVVMFDVLRVGGRDLRSEPWSHRREELESMPEVNGGSVKVSMVLPNDLALRVALDAGLEGVVFKRRRSTYQSGRRSPDWVKLKPQQTCDAKIVGFKDGKAGGEWSGKVGSFEIELVDNGARTTIKCGTNVRHREATAERAGEPIARLWLGALIEIKHHGIQKSGVPLHPQFLRRRGDLESSVLALDFGDVSEDQVEQIDRKRRPPVASKRRMRNYRQMRPENLLRAAQELREGLNGDVHLEAYARCVESGSGDPAGDLVVVERLIVERDLRTVA